MDAPTNQEFTTEELMAANQLMQISLALTQPLIRNRNIIDPKDAVSLYTQVYQTVLETAENDQQNS